MYRNMSTEFRTHLKRFVDFFNYKLSVSLGYICIFKSFSLSMTTLEICDIQTGCDGFSECPIIFAKNCVPLLPVYYLYPLRIPSKIYFLLKKSTGKEMRVRYLSFPRFMLF